MGFQSACKEDGYDSQRRGTGCVSRHESQSCPGLNWVVLMPELWLEKTQESAKGGGVTWERSAPSASLGTCSRIFLGLALDDVVLCQRLQCCQSFPLISKTQALRFPFNVLQRVASTFDVWPNFHNSSQLSRDFIPVTSVGFVGYLCVSSAPGQGCMWIGTMDLAPVVIRAVRMTNPKTPPLSVTQLDLHKLKWTRITVYRAWWWPMLALLTNCQCLVLATTLRGNCKSQVSFADEVAQVERGSHLFWVR